MLLILATLHGTQQVTVSHIQVETDQGYYTILPGHAPLLLGLKPDSLVQYISQDGARGTCRIGEAALVHIDRQQCRLLYVSADES